MHTRTRFPHTCVNPFSEVWVWTFCRQEKLAVKLKLFLCQTVPKNPNFLTPKKTHGLFPAEQFRHKTCKIPILGGYLNQNSFILGINSLISYPHWEIWNPMSLL